jgi:hypothetical protein
MAELADRVLLIYQQPAAIGSKYQALRIILGARGGVVWCFGAPEMKYRVM